jgi:hypothetical protein
MPCCGSTEEKTHSRKEPVSAREILHHWPRSVKDEMLPELDGHQSRSLAAFIALL